MATVLFADLSGYTAVAEQMDPEAVKSLLDRALRRLGQEVSRYGGRVDKYIGDNVMGVFGAPVAHEDDPERAVRAGLGMQAAMDEINDEIASPSGVEFALRVGVNSGEVLAGQVGDEYTVMGDPVNVASRLQSAARPGSVTVGEATARLTRQAIEYEPLEPLELKGKSEPVPAWEATRVLADATRRVSRGKTPLIGREDETALLESLFERVVREGRPHLVTVIGPAGVGKSRLMREVVGALAARPEPAASPRRALSGVRSPDRVLGARRGDPRPVRDRRHRRPPGGVEKLRRRDRGAGLRSRDRRAAGAARGDPRATARDRAERGRQLDRVAFEVEDPQQMRDRLFSAARWVIEAVSRRRPLLLAFEDIHWADEGMLDLIEYLARWVRGSVLGIGCLARDELLDRRSGWGGGHGYATTISLEPLGDEETRELVGDAAARPGGRRGQQPPPASRPRSPSAPAEIPCSRRR